MKKIAILAVFLLVHLSGCQGYKPIFSYSNLEFIISGHNIDGDKKLGNQIYSKLYNISKSNEKNPEARTIYLGINASKDKIATVKSSTGKILEFKINLNINVIVKDYLTSEDLLNQDFNYSTSYKVQDQHSETIKLENRTTKALIDKTFENLLIKISKISEKQ